MLCCVFSQAEFGYAQCYVNIKIDSLDVDTLEMCEGDSIQLDVMGENVILFEDFAGGNLGPGWHYYNPGFSYQTACDTSNSGHFIWFGDNVAPDRILETEDLDLNVGGYVSFDLKFSLQNGNPGCEGPDEMLEGVSLQYSTNQGASWIDIIYFCPDGTFLPTNPWVQAPLTMFPTPFTVWANYLFTLPAGAMTNHTRIRWIQESTSYFNGHYDDNWGLDNIKISRSIMQEIQWAGGLSPHPPVVSPPVTTTYYVYVVNYLDPADTLASDSVMLLVHPRPDFIVSGDTLLCFGDTTVLTASGNYAYVWDLGATGNQVQLQPLQNTLYGVTALNEFGCSKTLTGEIIVHLLPEVEATSDTVCFGENALLIASGASHYSWSNNHTGVMLLVTAIQNSSYWVVGTDNNGCSDTAIAYITVHPLPENHLQPDTLICYGEELVLTAGGGINYYWNTGENTAEIITHPLLPGCYKVTVFDQYGCLNTDSTLVSIHPLDSIWLSYSDDTVCKGNQVVLESGGGREYLWNTGEHNHEVIVYPAYTTIYKVTVSDVFQGLWCSLSGEIQVEVIECDNIFFPNAITPKGYNPVFKPIGDFTSLFGYQLSIHDRWGNTLFISDNPETGWDGTWHGDFVPDGIYVYQVRFNRTIKGDPFYKKGSLMVIY